MDNKYNVLRSDSTVPNKRGVQIVGDWKNLENLISGVGPNKREGNWKNNI